MKNEEIIANNNEKQKTWDEYFNELEDSDFKKFYKKNLKEKKYLKKKVKGNELEYFAKKEFSLADVTKCLYIKEFRTKYAIKRKNFEKNVLDYANEKYTMTESSDIEKLVNYSVEYIEKLSADEEEYSDFHAYDPFRSNEARRLTRALIYTFHNQFITKRFKISDNIHSEWSIRPLEAMFMFLLRDDKYRKNVKAIINGKVKMVEKGFMNTITLYLNELTIPKK